MRSVERLKLTLLSRSAVVGIGQAIGNSLQYCLDVMSATRARSIATDLKTFATIANEPVP